jgi:hypothetical protein
VFGHLLDPSGQPGAEFRIDASTLNTGPFVFASEGQYLVAYARSGMHLVRVSDTGSVGTIIDLSSNVTLVGGASSGTSTLVTWNDGDGSTSALSGRFVVSGAFSGDAFEISPDSAGYASALAWDGGTYWAVWESPLHALMARSIGADGTLGAVSTLVAEESYAPVLATDGHGQLLLSYAKLAGDRQSTRVVSRIVGQGAGTSTGGGAGAGSGGGAGAGSAGMTSMGAGGTSAAGSGTGGTTPTGAAGTSAAGAGTGGISTSGGTSGSGGALSGSAGRGGAAGRNAGGGSGPAGPLCSLSSGGRERRSPGYAALFGLAWALVATRRRRRAGSRGDARTPRC